MAEACAGLARIREQADCVELRLDLFEEPFDLPALMRACQNLPVVATLRPPAEGGRSDLAAADRLKVLVQAAELGAEYVDLEWAAATPRAQSAIRGAGARVIVSRHDFTGMPAGLATEWWPQLAGLGADVVKVVGTARDLRDCLAVFRALARADRPTIAIAMGAPGLISRVLAPRYEQCLLTYAALDNRGGTAPGQLTAGELRDVYRVGRLRTTTRVYGLLGPHTEVDRLAEYNAWFAADDVDGVAVPFVVAADAASVIEAFRELPVSGWHIHGETLQRDVLSLIDDLTEKAARQRKANAVVRREDGTLRGGWVESPREQYEMWAEWDVD
jgi:3-dehydroquinate dehydratase type I